MITSFEPIESIKHTFLMNLRTGNIIIDGILTTIIISLIANFYNYHNKINFYFQKIIKFFWEDNTQKISFNCTEIASQYSRGGRLKMHGSDAFKAIMLNIRENIKKNNISGLNCLREFCGDQDEHYWDSDYNSKSIDETIKDIIYLIDQDDKFTINNEETSNLYFQMNSSSEEQTEGEDKKRVGKHTIYTLSICSDTEDLDYIQKYINITLDNYLKKVNEKVNTSQFVFVYEGMNTDNDTIFTTYPFHTTCNIDTIYFEGKNEIMKQIDFFRDNKSWYEKYGKPYTLGICSYGKPGCGKTSFEKALAKYLNRHLIIVDISKIKTQKEADQIFFSEKINGKDIPYDKRIYIFPDIDAMDSVMSRENKDKENNTTEINQILENIKKKDVIEKEVIALLEYYDNPKPKDHNNDPINLSKMLNIIDGIPERTGQIMICCTNHPEKLDPALLRPGRVDCLIHFDKMTSENVLSMINNYSNEKNMNKKYNKITERIKKCDKFWTPAEVFQICSKYENTKDILDFIIKCKKTDLQ
jgi:SpoVK/Ycf46/Vps4 family AAA+-type ATPase